MIGILSIIKFQNLIRLVLLERNQLRHRLSLLRFVLKCQLRRKDFDSNNCIEEDEIRSFFLRDYPPIDLTEMEQKVIKNTHRPLDYLFSYHIILRTKLHQQKVEVKFILGTGKPSGADL